MSVLFSIRGRAAIVYSCKVRRLDGHEVKLGNDYSDIAELLDCVLEASTRQLTPQKLSIIPPKSIGALTTFTIDRQGISSPQERFSWQEIQKVMIKNGALVLLTKEQEKKGD